MSLLSTYRPTELGSVEKEILYYFSMDEHKSTYDIFKQFQDKNRFTRSISYKNIHKRIKRLKELDLIQPVIGNFDKGAKPLKITSYGITSLFSNFLPLDIDLIQKNKNNIVIQSLLLKYFEEKTIDSFSDRGTKARVIDMYLSDYVVECCSLIKNRCSEIQNHLSKYDHLIRDILPPDNIIQKYMIYLDERSVEPNIIEEIEKYKSNLSMRLKPLNIKDFDFTYNYYLKSKHNTYDPELLDMELEKDPTKIVKEPPFPLNYIYSELNSLDNLLYRKIRSLTTSLVNIIGTGIQLFEDLQESTGQKTIDLLLDNFGGKPMKCIIEDKKLSELVKDIKRLFDSGYAYFVR
ncbi:MAG: hypothetical protein ACPKPY_11100 [Nitrososphaeraceae archaeon]